MDQALEDVAFLARSPNRVHVLEHLAESPHDRRDLEEATGASRVTLGRILSAFEDRGWIVRGERTHRTTALGDLVLEDFDALCATTETAYRFREVARYLPAAELDFDLRRLSDADLVTATPADPLAVAREAATWMRDASEVRILAHAVTSEVLGQQRDAALERDQRSEVVLSAETYDAIVDDAEMRSIFRDLLDSGKLEAYRHDGAFPFTIGVYDRRTVAIAFVDDNAYPAAAALTADEAIREWADGRLDEYRDASQPVTADEFSR